MSRKADAQGGEIRRSSYRRGQGPNCANPKVQCNHALPFHGGEAKKGKCEALGCQCQGWVEPKKTKTPAVASA